MKRVFSLLIVLLLLATAGCQQQETKTNTGKAFVGGNKGIEVTFLTGLPPAEVFDIDNPFHVGIKIENKGEYDIENPLDIKATITGIKPSDFKVKDPDLSKFSDQALSGVRIDSSGNIVAGDYTTLEFPEMNYYTSVSGSVPFTLRANVCYEYGTKSQGKLCVRKDLRGVTGESSICDPNRVVPAENSGAPIQITSIKQNVAGPNKIDFFFTIKKVGAASDTLHKMGTDCDSTLSNRDVVYVEVTDTKLGDLTCYGLKEGTSTKGYITLFNGEREVRCTQTITNPKDFETVIGINLRYAYNQFIDKELKVKHAN